MRPNPRVFAVVDFHRCARAVAEKPEDELTALNTALVMGAIAKMETANAAIFESRP
jgi:hypothetical protein